MFKRRSVLMCLQSLLFGSLAFAEEAQQSPKVGGRVQVLGVGESLRDDYADDNRVYLFVKQARLNLGGKKGRLKYYMEMGFAGEEETVVAPNPGIAMNLVDVNIDWSINDHSFLKVGQFKVPYSRERISDSGYMQFDSRSVQNLAFRVGRDVGIAFHSYPGDFAYTLGIFTGGGRDIPERYIPENFGFPMLVFRAGLNNGYDENLFTAKQTKLNTKQFESGVFANGLYIKDTLIGHSSVLNVKLAEKSLIINSNWNPYIAQTPTDKGSLWQAGLDAALRSPQAWGTFSAEAELNYAKFWNTYGELKVFGGRAQASYLWGIFETSLRYAFILPDNFAYAYTDTTTKTRVSRDITGKKPIHEVTPALSYFFPSENAKILLNFPILIQVPVAVENGVGSYVLTEQIDQTSVLSKNTGSVERKNVFEARLMLQVIF
jgi:hypothetical protein